MWEDLENFRPVSECVCPVKCSCVATRNNKLFREQDYALRFLDGLDEKYSQVRAQILMKKTLPPLNRIFTLVSQQEIDMVMPDAQDESRILINATNTGSGSRSYGRGRGPNSGKVCTFCGKTGHTVEVCYRKHGFPPNFKFKNQSAAHNVLAEETEEIVDSVSPPKVDSTTNSPLSFTPEQYKSLLALLQHKNTQDSAQGTSVSVSQMSSSPLNPSGIHHFVLNCASPSFGNSWILDSGATDHVCNSPSWFTSHYPIKPIQVRLPNDHYVLANIAGTVSFPNTLTLTNVLYVPNFSFNLISISQLTSDQRYSLTFSSNGCQIQDMRCMRMIGSVSLVGGLYYLLINQVAGYQRLSSLPRVNHVSSISQNRLWHYRLGHPSSQRMSLISQEFPFVKFHKVEPCDICQFARQKRLSYAVVTQFSCRRLIEIL